MPGNDPRDLSQQQIPVIREFLEGDLFQFAWFIFHFHDLSPSLHGELAGLIGKWGQPGLRRIMIQISRNFLKSSLCSIANPLWQVCREPNEPVAIFNEKLDNAAKWVRTIRDTVESSLLFQTLWPHLMPPGKGGPEDTRTTPRWWKWNDEEITFQRDRVQPEPSISALGIGSASAGRHWPKIIFDDLISEDAARSPTVMATVKEWVDTAVYLERPALQGQVLVACTPWTYDDVYTYLLRKYDYVLYRRSALENADGEEDILGESIFPEKFSTKVLRKQLERDDYSFMAQMQCTPRPGRDRSFDPKWLRFGEVVGPPDRLQFRIRTEDYDSAVGGDSGLREKAPPVINLATMYKALLWDPAPTEQNEIRRSAGSRNGLVVVGRDPWDRLFVLDCLASREDPLRIIQHLFRLVEQWSIDMVGIEEVNFSMLYRHWLLQEMQRRGKWLSLVRLSPENRQKDARVLNMIPSVRTGLFYFNRGAVAPLLKEVVEFPHGSLRDLVDALAYQHKVPRPEAWEEVEQRLVADRLLEQGYNPVTGY